MSLDRWWHQVSTSYILRDTTFRNKIEIKIEFIIYPTTFLSYPFIRLVCLCLLHSVNTPLRFETHGMSPTSQELPWLAMAYWFGKAMRLTTVSVKNFYVIIVLCLTTYPRGIIRVKCTLKFLRVTWNYYVCLIKTYSHKILYREHILPSFPPSGIIHVK